VACLDSDPIALPSQGEDFGMTVIESLACGCSVLTSDRVRIYKGLEVCPLVRITRSDVKNITKKMVELHKQRTMSAEKKEKARLFTKRKFGRDALTNGVYDMYKEAIRVQ